MSMDLILSAKGANIFVERLISYNKEWFTDRRRLFKC